MEVIINNKDVIMEFITKNNLEFVDGNRNAPSVILCGYALYLGIEDVDDLLDAIEDISDALTREEIRFVFSYAKRHNYEKFWEKKEAHSMYFF